MRRSLCTLLVVWLALALPAATALARPPKRRPARRAPATSARGPANDDAPAPPSDDTSPRDDKAARDDKPAAAEEPAPRAATPADEGPAPPPPDPVLAPGPAVDLKKLRADYDRLRDELFRARSRAQVVQEGVWNARLGAELRWKAAPDYVIRHAEVRLDGGTIWDSGDKPVTDDKLTIAERACKPGPHSLTLRLEVRPGTKKKGKDPGTLGYSTEHTFAIVVAEGQRTLVALTGDEDGSLPEYEPRIELELETEALKK